MCCSVTALDMTLMYKQVVAERAVHLQLLDASLLQPEACSERIKRVCDRWVGNCGVWLVAFNLPL